LERHLVTKVTGSTEGYQFLSTSHVLPRVKKSCFSVYGSFSKNSWDNYDFL